MANNPPRQSILFSVGFRPFFLAAGGYGALSLGAWTGWLGEFWALPEVYPPGALHAHEMMFGFALAAVAGFLLTAVPQWTASTPLRGAPLAALAVAWLVGRLAVLGAGMVGPMVAMAADLLFPLGLCLAVGSMLVKAQNRRNYGFIVLLGLAALANFCWHFEMSGLADNIEGAFADELSGTALELMLNLLLIIVAIMGGRVIPMFSANWMRRQGEVLPIVHPEWLKRGCIIGLILVAGAEFLSPFVDERYIGILAILAGLAYLIRLWGWNGYKTYAHPLVWILHLAYFWLCLSLFLKGGLYLGGYMGDVIPEAAARHAAAVGAVGSMIMAIMPRVSLGHSGRDLILPRPMLAAYALFVLAPILRVASPFLDGELYQLALMASGLCWTAAFAIFLATFAPILLSPRVD
jgi:uncharacterized protein involved in response to NO